MENKYKLKKIVNEFINKDIPVKLEWLTQCGINLENEETMTDENLECLKQLDK